ncbi:MAG: hypothetical protein ABI852_13160 [Gemmatimonadaceae bacterium]
MSWLNTIVTAVVTAAIGTLVSGYLANLSVRWYRISSFEGGSGYYVVGLALCGLAAGLIIGLVVSRVVAASAHPNTLLALLYSATTMLVVAGTAGGVGRLLADIPPTIDGEKLMLHVEARWPNTRADSPANTPGVAYLDLGAETLLRRPDRQRGALWKEDAHKVDGSWVVNGVAPIVTSRGTPTIEVALNETERASFTLPALPHPTSADSAWSTWYPTQGKGGPTKTDGVTYRYRILKISEPVRTEHIGDFAISAIVSYFKPVDIDGMSTIDFYGTFRVAFKGKPIPSAANDSDSLLANLVIKLPGSRTALLTANGSSWQLLTDEAGTLKQQRVAAFSHDTPAELTNNAQRMAETREPRDLGGRVNVATFAHSQMLLFDNAVLNIEKLEVYPFTAKGTGSVIPSVPPLGVSPDAQSFVRFMLSDNPVDGVYPPKLAVTDFVRDTVYEIPIDPAHINQDKLEELNTAWLARYFVWKRDAKGIDRLEAR